MVIKIKNIFKKEVIAVIITGIIFASFFIIYNISKLNEITLYAVGDIMLDRGVEKMVNEQGKGDFKFPFLKIAKELKKADILFGNLEGPVSNKEGEKYKKSGDTQVYFKMDPGAINGLLHAGFGIVSVANNHSIDYGRQVFEDSLINLKNAGIEYAGGGFDEGDAFSVRTKEIKNTKIGFLAYTYPRFDGQYIPQKPSKDQSGVNVIEISEIEKIKKDIEEAKKQVDILIISLHWGDEYSPKPNEDQVFLNKAFIDAGADLVIGSHPHVLQPLEKYKEGWIAYSLGNFVFDMTGEETTKSGILDVKIKDKKIKEVKLTKVKISDSFQPTLPNPQF